MVLSIIFGALVATLTISTYSMDDCIERDFEPKACKTAEFLNKAKK